MEQPQQGASGKNVIAHGSENPLGVARHSGSFRIFFMERHDVPVRGNFHNAELGSVPFVHGDGCHRDLGIFVHVEVDHAGDVHAVDVVAAENRHHVRIRLFHQVDVLIDGVGGALVPDFAGGASEPAPE